jgi:hypothetical protein
VLAWILLALGLALVLWGLVVGLRFNRVYSMGLITLANVSVMGHALMTDSLGFAAFHLLLAVASLGLWIFMALREEA